MATVDEEYVRCDRKLGKATNYDIVMTNKSKKHSFLHLHSTAYWYSLIKLLIKMLSILIVLLSFITLYGHPENQREMSENMRNCTLNDQKHLYNVMYLTHSL